MSSMNKEPIHIIIFRDRGYDLDLDRAHLIDMLRRMGLDKHMRLQYRGSLLAVGKQINIYFRSDRIECMTGMVCDYYNADSRKARLELKHKAAKRHDNPKESSFVDICKIVMDCLKEEADVDNN